MHILFFCIVGVSLGVVGWQVAVWSGETLQKNRRYKAAAANARKTGKPLLVAGGPWSNRGVRRWLNMPAHGGGDVCLDIERRAFRGHPCGVIADVTRIPFCDKAFGAVFASHILEHLPSTYHADRALDELNRVAETVFLAYPSRQSVGAWLHPGHYLWVWQKGDTVYLKQRNDTVGKKTADHHPVITVKHTIR
ncbi:MAG: methyltransferase domain-containing protein [Chloroflexota bacterium]|nr:MAG: methyltransferase domain-containing protein [Chloroflexota bacterium]